MKTVKNVKKLALMLVCVMLTGILSGCGTRFDAVAYLEANLNNIYKNDSTGLVNLKIATAEEASAIYTSGIDGVKNAMLDISVSDELDADFREIFVNIFGNVKYTVNKAEKQDDNSYIVTVTCEQEQVFGPMVEDYLRTLDVLSTDPETANLPEDEQTNLLMEKMRDSFNKALDNVTYGEPVEATVRIDLADRVYTARQSDLDNLVLLLIDVDMLQNIAQ